MSFQSNIKDMGYTFARSVIPARNSGVILMYHSISDARHFGAVTPENFAQQMQSLKDDGFNVVSLDRLAEYRKDGRIPPKTVCITFDDGYRDNYTGAFPVLKRHAFPASIFVITDSIGKKWETRGEEFDMLSEQEIRELSASGLISIEPHTASHPKLHQLLGQDVEREVRASKEKLESITGKSCQHFAYPKGGYNDTACAAVARVGIAYAYATHEGIVRPKDDNFTLNRNGINRTISLTQFRGIAACGRLSKVRIRRAIGL